MEPIILKQENLNISDETYLCFYINPFDYTAEDIKKIKTDLEQFFNRRDKIIILPDNIKDYYDEPTFNININSRKLVYNTQKKRG